MNEPRQPTLAHCSLIRQAAERLTCPQSSSPTPTKRHQSHCSMLRGAQLKGFPPHCTITIYGRNTGRDIETITNTNHHCSPLTCSLICKNHNTRICPFKSILKHEILYKEMTYQDQKVILSVKNTHVSDTFCISKEYTEINDCTVKKFNSNMII